MSVSLVVQNIIESSLSRIWRHLEEHDAALISGFRYELVNCVQTDDVGQILTLPENRARHRQLGAALLKLRYGVTAINGAYIENYGSDKAKEVNENTHLVVNLKDDPQFNQNIIDLGEFYCQDAVLFKPKGQAAYLYGTNYHPEPGYHNKVVLGGFHGGLERSILSRKDGRPFVFEHWDQLGIYAKYLADKASAPVLKLLRVK